MKQMHDFYSNAILSNLSKKQIKIKREHIMLYDEIEMMSTILKINNLYEDKIIFIDCKNDKNSILNILAVLLSNNKMLLIDSTLRKVDKEIILTRLEKLYNTEIIDIEEVKENDNSILTNEFNYEDFQNRLKEEKIITVVQDLRKELILKTITNEGILDQLSTTIEEISKSEMKEINIFVKISSFPILSLIAPIMSPTIKVINIHAHIKDFYFDMNAKDTLVLSTNRSTLDYIKRNYIKHSNNLKWYEKLILFILKYLSVKLLKKYQKNISDKIWNKYIGDTKFITIGSHFNSIVRKLIKENNLPIRILNYIYEKEKILENNYEESKLNFKYSIEDSLELLPFVKEVCVVRNSSDTLSIIIYPNIDCKLLSRLDIQGMHDIYIKIIEETNKSFNVEIIYRIIEYNKELKKNKNNEIIRDFYELIESNDLES